VTWIGRALAAEGTSGGVAARGRQLGVSRQTVTDWRAGGAALLPALAPAPARRSAAGPERSSRTLLVVGHASYRGVQACLAEWLGRAVSLGAIAGVVATAGARAALLACRDPAAPVALALAEIFGGALRHGDLGAVDARSGVVWAAPGPVVLAAAAWPRPLAERAARGARRSGLAHDGGKAAAGGDSDGPPPAGRLARPEPLRPGPGPRRPAGGAGRGRLGGRRAVRGAAG